MTPAYSEMYLGDASLALGSMLESAVYLFGVELNEFWRLFLASHVSSDFARGLSGTVSGKSGKPKGVVGRSREFWTGWALAQ